MPNTPIAVAASPALVSAVAGRFAQRARRAADVIASWLGERGDDSQTPSVEHALVAVSTHICLGAPEVTFCAITDRSGRLLAATDNAAASAVAYLVDQPLASNGDSVKVHRNANRTRELVRVSIHSPTSSDTLGELWVGYRSAQPNLALVE